MPLIQPPYGPHRLSYVIICRALVVRSISSAANQTGPLSFLCGISPGIRMPYSLTRSESSHAQRALLSEPDV